MTDYKYWTPEDYLKHGRALIEEKHPELLSRQAQGGVIEQQAQTILAQAQSIEHLKMQNDALVERIADLEAALHTSLSWTNKLVAERDARIEELEAARKKAAGIIRRFREFTTFCDYWTVLNEKDETE